MSEIAGLKHAMGELLSRVEALENENARLRLSSSAGTEPEASDSSPFTRRRLLMGGAGVAAASAISLVATGSPAAAGGQGEAFTSGASNSATASTSLFHYGTSGTAFYVETSGDGGAGGFRATKATSEASVFSVQADGLGPAQFLWATKPANPSPVLNVLNDGAGSAGKFWSRSSTNSETVVEAQTDGLGSAGNLYSSNPTSDATVLNVQHDGVGRAAYLNATNASNPEPALLAVTAGTGSGVLASSESGVAAALKADRAQLLLDPTNPDRTAPTSDPTAHSRGEVLRDGNGDLWYCATEGTPGVWRKLAGPSTAGSFHVLPAPVRVYDSRPNTPPAAIGPKTPLAANTARVVDLTLNNSGIPAGATAAMVTCSVVNVPSALGNLTIWANGATRPFAASIVFGGGAGRFSTLAVTALDASGTCQVIASLTTDVALDVIGYYR